MADDVVLLGAPVPGFLDLGGALRRAGLAVHEDVGTGTAQSAILVILPISAEDAIEAAQAFAASDPAARPRLIVLIRHVTAKDDWPGSRDAALALAFTRYAALNSASRNVRVNALELGGGVVGDDVADAILALWRWQSMTGQTIRLDVR